MLAELTEDKVGVEGVTPNGALVAATLFTGNRHEVAECHDDWLVLVGADGTCYRTSWQGIRIVMEEKEEKLVRQYQRGRKECAPRFFSKEVAPLTRKEYLSIVRSWG